MNNLKRKRVTMKLKHPNPLFAKWLTEWRDKAREENSKMQYCFSTALQSLKRYPLPLSKGKDCKILKGFGDKLCLMIDNKLKEHEMHALNNFDITNNETENELHQYVSKRRKSHNSDNSPSKVRKRSNEYLPQEGSGSFAILVTLYAQHLSPSSLGFLTKEQIITEGQHLSRTSFSKPDPGSRYTAWSSMKTLVAKNLVIKTGNPAKFSLSDEGLALARRLFEKGKDLNINTFPNSSQSNSEVNDCVKNKLDLSEHLATVSTSSGISGNNKSGALSKRSDYHESIFDSKTNCDGAVSSSVSSGTYSENENLHLIDMSGTSKSKQIKKYASSSSVGSSTVSEEESFILFPNTFDIILYVDTCETVGNTVFVQDEPILSELKHLGVAYEVKKLTIGDYIWICRDRISKKELVLPYIIERKRMDDFGSSIKDGRYHEQKFRLKRSGIQNITYLIESYGNNQHVSLPITTLHQAATNTAIQDNFSVKFTKNVRDTAKYLAYFSTVLIKTFQSKTLASCPRENISEISVEDDFIPAMSFTELNKISSKNRPSRISDLFVKMLIQIRGMSVDKALAIVKEYPTPALLKKAYDVNPGVSGEKLLTSIQFGDCTSTIGPVLSKIVYQLFTLQNFN